MTNKARRRELREQLAQHPPDAGVYAIRHHATGRVTVASAVKLAGASSLGLTPPAPAPRINDR